MHTSSFRSITLQHVAKERVGDGFEEGVGVEEGAGAGFVEGAGDGFEEGVGVEEGADVQSKDPLPSRPDIPGLFTTSNHMQLFRVVLCRCFCGCVDIRQPGVAGPLDAFDALHVLSFCCCGASLPQRMEPSAVLL